MRAKILVVDDEPGILTSMQALLENRGYRVSVTQDPLDALDIFENAPDEIDLVITDMAMPKLAGDKLAAELMKIRPETPIILNTGYSDSMTEEKAAALGIKGFLYKPVGMHDLSKKIREILDDRQGDR